LKIKKYLWKIECYKDEKNKVIRRIKSEGLKITKIKKWGEIYHIYFRATEQDALKLKGLSRGKYLGLFKVIKKGG
jgi:hypothetical protein